MCAVCLTWQTLAHTHTSLSTQTTRPVLQLVANIACTVFKYALEYMILYYNTEQGTYAFSVLTFNIVVSYLQPYWLGCAAESIKYTSFFTLDKHSLVLNCMRTKIDIDQLHINKYITCIRKRAEFGMIYDVYFFVNTNNHYHYRSIFLYYLVPTYVFKQTYRKDKVCGSLFFRRYYI